MDEFSKQHQHQINKKSPMFNAKLVFLGCIFNAHFIWDVTDPNPCLQYGLNLSMCKIYDESQFATFCTVLSLFLNQ